MKVGDLVRILDGGDGNMCAMMGDVVLLLENHGEKRYHGTEPGLLFSGMLVSSPEDTNYFVFEHDAEVINEGR